MNENRMAEVAKLFGKGLDEEFKVKSTIRNSYSATVVFTSSGLFISDAGPIVVSRMTILDDLLTGEAVIIDD
jgi:hypothetical protein